MKLIPHMYVLACFVSLAYAQLRKGKEPMVVKDVVETEYLCDCGWREAIRWNDCNVMINVY